MQSTGIITRLDDQTGRAIPTRLANIAGGMVCVNKKAILIMVILIILPLSTSNPLYIPPGELLLL
jgi:hypothetical protein